MSEFATIAVTLASVIVTLVGVFVWAIKFTLGKLFGKGGAWDRLLKSMDGLRKDLAQNTEVLTGMEGTQRTTNQLLMRMAERSPLVGEETLSKASRKLNPGGEGG